MFETMLAFSDSSKSFSPVHSREKEIMRRSSINPFAMSNSSVLPNIQEETYQVQSNPFQTGGLGLTNKLSISSKESETVSNPFMKISKKVSNPFAQNSNPFQANPSMEVTNTQMQETVEDDSEINGLIQKLSLKIEVKDIRKNSSHNMVFLEENQKRQILKILKPFLTSELNDPHAEMVMKIKSRKNSVDQGKMELVAEVDQIPEESEPSEKDSKKEFIPIPEFSKDRELKTEIIETKQITMGNHMPVQNTQTVITETIMSSNQMAENQQFNQEMKQMTNTISNVNYQPVNQIETIQYSRPITQKAYDPLPQNTFSNEIKEQTNYQYISQNKADVQYEISPSYQAMNSNPTLNKTKDFKLKSVIRSITTTKRPSFLRQQMENQDQMKMEEDNFQMTVNKTQFPLANIENSVFKDSTVNLQQSNFSQNFLEGNNSYIRLQSNKFQESQVMSQTGNLESNFTSGQGGNYQANYISIDKYNAPVDSIYQTQEVTNLEKNNTYQVTETKEVKEEPKIELYQLVQKNRLIDPTPVQTRQSERVISKKYQTRGYYSKPRQQTYTPNTTVIDSTFTERLTHDPISVNRQNVLSNLNPKPVKRSFTNGLRIFRKVKDSQGNIVKENMEQSINIYSNKILTTMQKKKYETVDTMTNIKTETDKNSNMKTLPNEEDISTRNYKTHVYTTSTITTPVVQKRLTSDRIISSLTEKNRSANLLYSSNRNIDDNQFTYSQPKKTTNNQLSTSIFYSGTKTENNSGRNSNIKANYVRSTRVSPAITIGSRSQGIYCKVLYSINS